MFGHSSKIAVKVVGECERDKRFTGTRFIPKHYRDSLFIGELDDCLVCTAVSRYAWIDIYL
jgi:hypothetical protein